MGLIYVTLVVRLNGAAATIRAFGEGRSRYPENCWLL
jgi:hypothetical protein